jgi:hypothetical protein
VYDANLQRMEIPRARRGRRSIATYDLPPIRYVEVLVNGCILAAGPPLYAGPAIAPCAPATATAPLVLSILDSGACSHVYRETAPTPGLTRFTGAGCRRATMSTPGLAARPAGECRCPRATMSTQVGRRARRRTPHPPPEL